jgi:hypothetical protein
MNKITSSIILIVGFFLLFSSCSKKNSVDSELIGTRWTITVGADYMTYHFVDKENVVLYENYDGEFSSFPGTYVYGNKNISIRIPNYYESTTLDLAGKVNGNVMTVSIYQDGEKTEISLIKE